MKDSFQHESFDLNSGRQPCCILLTLAKTKIREKKFSTKLKKIVFPSYAV